MESLTPTHCLDACAVIAYLHGEPGHELDPVEEKGHFRFLRLR